MEHAVQNTVLSEAGPCAPQCCPTAGTSVVPLVPLVRFLEAWLAHTSLSQKYFRGSWGHMASAATITPFGLLHIRPLQRWLHDWKSLWFVAKFSGCGRTLLFYGQAFP